MRIRNALLCVVFLGCSSAYAADPKYPVSEISEDIKKDADAVVREDKMVFTILAKNHAKLSSYFAVTILNPRGKKFANISESYDKLTRLNSFEGSVYDAFGKLIKKLKYSEIRDQSVFDGSSLFNDDRVKFADLEQNTYPYTVVFEYEKEYKFLFFIDSYAVLPSANVSLQHGSFDLIFPDGLQPRYKLQNTDVAPTSTKTGVITTLHWSFNNIKPMKFEMMGKNISEMLPVIHCAPGEFEYEGYAGNMKSWNDFGKWIADLNRGRDVLPEETKQKIKQLTAGKSGIEEKARVVYDFLQARSRYVGIQLGIGGLQPFEASVVDRTGYGDCKALSNYTVALLAEVGVKSNYVLIDAGPFARTLDPTFPSSQFNHATVCVPNGKDSLWLECTSQINPFGFASDHTGDRTALAITPEGAAIVHTTSYPALVNKRVRSAEVTLDITGNAQTTVNTRYSGLQYSAGGLEFILNSSHDDQKKWIEDNTNIPSFDIHEFTMVNKKEKLPTAIVTVTLGLNRLANVSGKRLFLTPNLMSRSTFVPEKVENRQTPVLVRRGHVEYDTIEYIVPEELYPEALPAPVVIKSKFGDYEANFKLEQGKVIYTRRMMVNKGEYPADTYNEMVDFYKKAAKADNTKIVFLNKT